MDIGCTMQSLHLRNNRFVGELPSSLKNCTQLTVLDLGNNKFSGKMPAWVGDSLPELVVLSLRSNQFHGRVPIQLCHLKELQVLDLSQNNISGAVPSCLNNLTAMTRKESLNAMITYPLRTNYYNDHAFLVWKRTDSEYRNTLGLVKSIDLSSNKLDGEIPEEVMSLVGLISLNLSRNSVIGPIPEKIGLLTSLNSLDLSRNMLTGEIPEGFSQLSLLGVLDLSYNKLSGKIPLGTQLQSFDASAYMEYPELCSLPLPNKCAEQEKAQHPAITQQDDKEDGIITIGFYVSIALGFITGFWGVCSTLLLNSSWRYAYFQF